MHQGSNFQCAGEIGACDHKIRPDQYHQQFFIMQFFFFIFFIAGPFIASPTSLQQAGEGDAMDVTEFLEILERRHQVTFFYEPEWLEGITVPPQKADMPLDEVLDAISETTNLDAVGLEDMIVLLPPGEQVAAREAPDDDRVIVGDPGQYGRYPTATISGVVRDGATGEALIGAVVYEPQTEKGATTNVHGAFELDLPVGEYNLRFSYIGYQERYYDIQLVSDGSATFEIFSETVHLDVFTLEADRAADNIRSTQMSLIRMDARTLEGLPTSFGEQDIVRSMTLLPGVQSVGEFGTGFNVRGGSADQNLILLEHVPLFNASHLFGLISVINPDMISDVTLIKAGIPARYGERASSVMDIRLGSGLDQQETSLRGGLGLINSRLFFETPIVDDRANFSFGARSSYSDWILGRLPNEDLMNSTARFHDFTARSNIALNPDNHLTLFGYYSFDRFGFLDEQTFEYTNTLASLRWNRGISSLLSSALILGYSRYDYQVRDEPPLNAALHSQLESEINYASLRYQFSYSPSRNHDMEFGLNAIYYDIMPGETFPSGEHSTVDHDVLDNEQALELALYVSDEWTIGERISAELGLRYTHYLYLGPATVNVYEEGKPLEEEFITGTESYDHNAIVETYSGLEPRLGFRYQTGEWSSVKLSYNRTNQYINLISNTSVMAPTDLWKLSDPHLEPLRSDQYALGYFRNFIDNTLETSLEGYFRNSHNALEYKSGADIMMNEAPEMDVINARGYGYGLELYVRKNAGRLTGWTSYTYSSSMRRSRSDLIENQINSNEYFPSNYDRPHNLVLNLNYQISRRWRFGAVFNYSTGRPVTLPEQAYRYGSDYLIHYSDRNKYRLPDYHRLDISITLGENLRKDQRGKGSWTISLMNVYGRKNPYSVFYKKDPAGVGGHRSFNLYQLYIMGRPLPTITYNYSF